MSSKGQILLPQYIFWNLREYKNSLIGRKYLIRYGSQRIVDECAAKGYKVKLVVIPHDDFSIVRKRVVDKSGEYPCTNTYVLQVE